MIDRLGGINPLENLSNTSKLQKTRDFEKPDAINISEEAKSLSEIYFAMDAVQAVPDIRADKVAEVLEKIKDPEYITQKIIDIVADRFLSENGI